MASFSGLTTADGLKALNDYLSTRSYIDGFCPSTADVTVLNALSGAPDAGKYPHAARWYYHISSFNCHKRMRFPAGKVTVSGGGAAAASAPAPAAKAAAAADDDDIDFFGEEDEDDIKEREMERKAQAALAAQAAKGKVKAVAKTNMLLDIKPWDDETDMVAMEAGVRAIEMDGLLWGSSKLVAVGYGIKKLQIICIVEDDKVTVDDLDERICALEDYVQSMDVAAMNKV